MAEASEPRTRAYHLYLDGRDAWLRNEPRESLEIHRKCLAEARQLSDTALCGAVLFEMGFILTSLDQYDEAADAYEECLLYYDQSATRKELSQTLFQLAQVYRLAGRAADAAEAYVRVQGVCRELADLRGEGIATSMLGRLRCGSDDVEGGLALMVRGVALVRSAAPEEAELMTEHVKWFGRDKLPPEAFARIVRGATDDAALLAELLG